MARMVCLAGRAQMLIFWSKKCLTTGASHASHASHAPRAPIVASPHLKQGGFTLLELLVAMVIISLMTAVVGFSVSSNPQRALKGEADKLAARLNAAHAQMNAGASPLRLIATVDAQQNGYAFETTQRADDGSASAKWVRVKGDDVLAYRQLPTGAALQLKEPLLIAREPITAPASVLLVQADFQTRVATDGMNGWSAQ